MTYQPPEDIWQVNVQLHPGEPLDGENDPRWVDTTAGRGEYNLAAFLRQLGVSGSALRSPPTRGYYLFCGHRGCGKSTELRRIRNQLHKPGIYYVVFADVAQELDVNNLRYPDVLLHLAGRLLGQLEEDGIAVPSEHLRRLDDWFVQRVEHRDETRDFALEARAGMEGQLQLPFVAKVFARISDTFKYNSTYKEELRLVLRNNFSDFAEAFNGLIEAAQDALRRNGAYRRILFVVDGTDRLQGDDANALFLSDVHQLQQVQGLFVYCAPVHLTYEATLGQNFDDVFRLPMIKVANIDGTPNDVGIATMRKMLFKRAAPSLFDDEVADLLIRYSGGHPRDLLRLLRSTFKYAASDRFDIVAARRGVEELATDFLHILDAGDYPLLRRIDGAKDPLPLTPQTRALHYNLALLEHNNLYWRSHPAIRKIDHYARASADPEHAAD